MRKLILEKLKEKKESPWIFFGVTFTLTWVFWVPAALSGGRIDSFLVMALIFMGGLFGKLVPPIVLPYLTYGKKGWRDYWRRLVDVKRVSPGWWAVTVLLPVFYILFALLGSALAGLEIPMFDVTNPLNIFPLAIFIMLYGPLPEELGWVGYELDRLQARYSALNSSLILGFFWLLWHLPLFFIAGSYQSSEVVFGSLRFWLTFCPGIISLQILQTWIYNNTNRSTLTAVIIHFMVNFTGELLVLTTAHEYFRTAAAVLITVGVVAIWGPKNLTGSDQGPNFEEIVAAKKIKLE